MTDCRCSRPTRDDRYLCDTCIGTLEILIAELPWLDGELDTTITRTKGIDYRALGGTTGGKKPVERPLPGNLGAGRARDHLKAILVSWVRFMDAEHIGPHKPMPADTIPAISGWLLGRVDALSLHDIAPEALDEIENAYAHCERLIDRPGEPQYLGECVAPLLDETPCGGDLYSERGGTWATCRSCGANEDADDVRAKLLGELDDRLCSPSEIAKLSTYLGLRDDRRKVEVRINVWANRGRIEPKGEGPLYRFGDVYRLLTAKDAS